MVQNTYSNEDQNGINFVPLKKKKIRLPLSLTCLHYSVIAYRFFYCYKTLTILNHQSDPFQKN